MGRGQGDGREALPCLRKPRHPGGVHWNIGKSKSKHWGTDEKPWNTEVTEIVGYARGGGWGMSKIQKVGMLSQIR